MTDTPETLGTAAKATITGVEADVAAIAAKIKADAKAALKAATLAVGSRAVYMGLGAVAMFIVLKFVL